jgi:hypothetical protein
MRAAVAKYAIKSSFVLKLLDAVPEAKAGLVKPAAGATRPDPEKFSVLVWVYGG